MWCCDQPAISDAAIVHLRGIHTLVMNHCNQATLTGAGFAHLQGNRALGMSNSRADLVAAARPGPARENAPVDVQWGAALDL
jgi:hypothetical protein